MKLSIYSIQSTIFDGEVQSISIPTPGGEITVLDNHIPLITILSRGFLRYTDSSNNESALPLPGGVVEVRPGSEVIILTREEKL